MRATYPDSKDITAGLRAAIDRADQQYRFYRHHANLARSAGNSRAEAQRLATAERFARALGRLEDLAGGLGLLAPCCRYAAQGEWCACS